MARQARYQPADALRMRTCCRPSPIGSGEGQTKGGISAAAIRRQPRCESNEEKPFYGVGP
jgi:hypothetical protein